MRHLPDVCAFLPFFSHSHKRNAGLPTDLDEIYLFVTVKIMSLVYNSSLCEFCSSTVRSLGLNPLGEDTGTAEVLSRVIIERMKWVHAYSNTSVLQKIYEYSQDSCDIFLTRLVGEDTNIPPLFFPCGSIKREVLPTALRDNGKHLPVLCRTIKSQGD